MVLKRIAPMLNASLNWASATGILLALWSIPSAALGAFQIFFILQRRADTSLQVILNTVFLLFQSLGRLVVMPLCGGILFFQGWRLDPILQFGISLLVFVVIIESFSGILADYQKWRARAGGVAANTAVKH